MLLPHLPRRLLLPPVVPHRRCRAGAAATRAAVAALALALPSLAARGEFQCRTAGGNEDE